MRRTKRPSNQQSEEPSPSRRGPIGAFINLDLWDEIRKLGIDKKRPAGEVFRRRHAGVPGAG